MNYELVMYSRTFGCPFVSIAEGVFKEYGIPYREIFIDQDPQARERVLQWTGFLSVPTLVIAQKGSDMPYIEPEPLPQGASPRGIDRGSMLTEPSAAELREWLIKHGFIEQTVAE